MEEENPSFNLNLEFLEPQVEEENEIEQCKADKEVRKFVKEQRNPKTVKKTELDYKTFLTFIQRKYSETRSLTEIPPNILHSYLSHFIMEVRKADGGEYEPDSLTSFRNSIQRFLTQQQYRYSLIDSREFSKHREVLKAKRKELKSKGKGRKTFLSKKFGSFKNSIL